MQLIDTHAHVHVDAFDRDRADIYTRAREAGVVRLINVGYDLGSSAASIDLAQSEPWIYATAGIQPHYASETGPPQLHELERLLRMPKVVALGEIGLDYHHDRAPRPGQRSLFEDQLALARAQRMPVVIHSRDAHDDTVDVLRAAAHPFPVVMHSFSGDSRYADACLSLGAFLSFSGPLTFPKATELHEVAAHAPLDRILVETDCPYLSPHPLRGRRNEPARVRLVAEQLAKLRGMTLDELAEVLWHNACMVFGLPADVDQAISQNSTTG
jgi:TatD DNase family protein